MTNVGPLVMANVGPLVIAEAALVEALGAVKAAEKVGTSADSPAVAPGAVAEAVAGSVYLGHIGEAAVAGKDF